LKEPEGANFSFHGQSKMPGLMSALLREGNQDGRSGISIHPLRHWADQVSFVATAVLCTPQPSRTRGPISRGLQLGHSEQTVLEAAVWTSALPVWPFLPA